RRACRAPHDLRLRRRLRRRGQRGRSPPHQLRRARLGLKGPCSVPRKHPLCVKALRQPSSRISPSAWLTYQEISRDLGNLPGQIAVWVITAAKLERGVRPKRKERRPCDLRGLREITGEG